MRSTGSRRPRRGRYTFPLADSSPLGSLRPLRAGAVRRGRSGRIVSERRARPLVWLALGAAGLSILLYWPMLMHLRRLYGGRYYWSTATIFRAVASYDEYMSLIPVGAMLGVIALAQLPESEAVVAQVGE